MQKQNKNNKKVVHFSNEVRIRQTKSYHDYTIRQIKACWYQEYEIDKNKLNCIHDIKYKLSSLQLQQKQKQKQKQKKKDNNNNEEEEEETKEDNMYDNDDQISSSGSKSKSDDDECYCFRGLESYLPKEKKRKQLLRRMAYNVVFDIQGQRRQAADNNNNNNDGSCDNSCAGGCDNDNNNNNNNRTTTTRSRNTTNDDIDDTTKIIAIAECYSTITWNCKLNANLIAIKDEIEVASYYTE